jgi:integrase
VPERQAARRVPGDPHVCRSRVVVRQPLEGQLKPWKRAAGLSAGLRIHDLRHGLASVLGNANTPLYEIGPLLGHRRLSTTTRYAHDSPQCPVGRACDRLSLPLRQPPGGGVNEPPPS